MLVAVVLGIDAQRGVAQHRFGTRCCHDRKVVRPFDTVLDMIHLPFNLVVLDLVIRQSGLVEGTPVHDILSAIDEPFVEHPDEHFLDGPRESFVHRKAFALPVGRNAELAELADDGASVFFAPLPNEVDEFFSSQFAPIYTLLCQRFFHDVLRGDAGVVGPRNPARFIPLHSPPTDENVLDGVVEDVPHRQNAGDVRRGNDDGEGLLGMIHNSMELPARFPGRIPAVFDVFGGICL